MDATGSWSSLPEFILAEIVEMENKYKEVGEESLNPEFCQRLATSFNCSLNRIEKPAITWQQVQSWFMDKQKEKRTKAGTSPLAESSRRQNGCKATDLSDLAFEARSAKDYAWYDVASFQTYRVLCTGELEVRVRFSGFGNTEDEWVNVREDVRERSIPLEPSECHRVNVGDLVLCFQERESHAVYCDAHVVRIQRRLHDIRGCRCIFLVRYDHDHTEENVQLKRLCCRPT